MTKHRAILLTPVLAVVLLGTMARAAAVQSRLDWDVLAYVACALKSSETDAGKLLERTYEAVRQVATPAEFQALTRADGYRDVVAHDAAAFAEQLPFYQHRVLYVAWIRACSLFGMNPAAAALAASNLALLALGLVLWGWMARSVSPLIALTGAAVLGIAAWPVGTDGSPDAMATALLAGAYAAAFASRPSVTVVFGTLCLLARSDLVLLLWPVLLTPTFSTRRGGAVLLGAGWAALAFGIYVALGGYAWSVVERHTFLGAVVHPSEIPDAFSLADYVSILSRVPARLVRSLLLPAFALAAVGLSSTNAPGRRTAGFACSLL